MKIISFIEKATQETVIEKILRHCGLWKEPQPSPPPAMPGPDMVEEPKLDYSFFDQACI